MEVTPNWVAEVKYSTRNSRRVECLEPLVLLRQEPDVMTRGSTTAQALHVLREQRPEAAVVVATAGQVIVKEAVLAERGFTNQ